MYTIWACTNKFLSTLSLRRATTQMQAAFKGPEISIHALLAESDLDALDTEQQTRAISIHALLAESDSVTTSFQGGFAISIHALLAESDD